jgi:hypothetical protein
MALLVIAGSEPRDLPVDWNADFYGGFAVSLLAVTPYTVIGAVLGGAAVSLLRRAPGKSDRGSRCTAGFIR